MIKNLNDIPAVAAYLTRINAEPRTLKTAVVKIDIGRYWKDKAIIRFADSGEVDAPGDYGPTETEANEIKLAFLKVEFPHSQPVPDNVPLPSHMRGKQIFKFHDQKGRLLMVQVRIDFKERGEKAYVPWSYWSDGQWRNCEPEGKLPLFGLEQIKKHDVVFIHEGAKAAAHCQNLPPDHPWANELSGAAHLGWIGGALNPGRTDFGVLRKHNIRRAYIVVDNDAAGRSITPAIAQRLHCVTFSLEFNDMFPVSFDLADPFPPKLFEGKGAKRFYTGPAFAECLHPSTWMTEPIEGKPGKPAYKLRDCARSMWAYVEEADMIICKEIPTIMYVEQIMNKVLAPYSHVKNTCALIIKEQLGRTAKITYRPDRPELVITSKDSSAINLHVPSRIDAAPGKVAPWREFMEYLIPDEGERNEVDRWCATLIARPDVRMGYGLLMVSEAQGIGKTTLGESVLAPLVGMHNVGFPSEQSIMSQYNDWAAHKRLAIVGEIYAGTSWKSYNLLKTIVTDRYIEVNKKYVPQYIIENYCHIYACSNSLRALKMDDADRRWYYPELVNIPWPKKKFGEFRKWLREGGLSHVKQWALDFGEYVTPAEHAPMTLRKRDLIDDSLSGALREARRLGGLMDDMSGPVAVGMREVRNWLREITGEKVYASDTEVRKAVAAGGGYVYPRRMRIDGELQPVILNGHLHDRIKEIDDVGEERKQVRMHILKPSMIAVEHG